VVQTGTLNPANHWSLIDLERLLSRTSSHTPATTRAMHFLKTTGETGLAVIQTMLEKTTGTTDKPLASSRLNTPLGLEGSSVETDCAGSFLLLRAVLDARLPMLLDTNPLSCHRHHFPLERRAAHTGTLLVGWAGLSNNGIDPALLILAGLENPLDLSDLQKNLAGYGCNIGAGFSKQPLTHLERAAGDVCRNFNRSPPRPGCAPNSMGRWCGYITPVAFQYHRP